MRRIAGIGILGWLLAAGVASAQPVPNRLTVTFTSADHDRVDRGVAVVERYDLLITGPTTVMVNIGKPAVSGGVVSAVVNQMLEPGSYVARVAAVGPGGTSAGSAPSSFVVPVPAPPLPSVPTQLTITVELAVADNGTISVLGVNARSK